MMRSDHLRTARLAIVGDVMLGRLVSRQIGHRAPETFWGDTLPILRGADAGLAAAKAAGKPAMLFYTAPG